MLDSLVQETADEIVINDMRCNNAQQQISWVELASNVGQPLA